MINCRVKKESMMRTRLGVRSICRPRFSGFACNVGLTLMAERRKVTTEAGSHGSSEEKGGSDRACSRVEKIQLR